MKILRTDIEDLANNKKMVYKLTKGTSTMVSKLTDEELDQSWPVDAYLQYEDESKDVTLLAILSNGKVLTGQSKPFQDAFFDIVDIMDGDPFSIHIQHFMSKKNRKFVTCTLD